MTTVIRQEALGAAVEASQFLAAWMQAPDLATLDQVEPTFTTLAELLEALPPTVADAAMMCYLRNRMPSSRAMFASGEWGPCQHQVEQIHRKLARLLTEQKSPRKPITRHRRATWQA